MKEEREADTQTDRKTKRMRRDKETKRGGNTIREKERGGGGGGERQEKVSTYRQANRLTKKESE